MPADPGVTGKIAVQDANGKPITGAWVAGLTEHWPITFKLPDATATVYALTPGKPRMLFVYHPGQKLGGSVTVRGDETEPVVVKLGPLGQVKGRLLDADGQPLGGVDVSIAAVQRGGDRLPGGRSRRRLPHAEADLRDLRPMCEGQGGRAHGAPPGVGA